MKKKANGNEVTPREGKGVKKNLAEDDSQMTTISIEEFFKLLKKSVLGTPSNVSVVELKKRQRGENEKPENSTFYFNR